MNWTTTKPTQPGYYIWREIGSIRPFRKVAFIYNDINKTLIVNFRGTEDEILLDECADREWIGPLPE